MTHIVHYDGTDEYHCVLDDCEWTHTVAPLRAEINEGTLAEIFGPGQMLLNARNQRRQDIERALQDHFKSHPHVDYLRTITRLRQLVAAQPPEVHIAADGTRYTLSES